MGRNQAEYGMFEDRVAHVTWGEGPRTLLFTPGGIGVDVPRGMPLRVTQGQLRPFVEAGYRVRAARARAMPAGHTIPDMAEDIAAMVRGDLDGRVDIVLGQSLGGLVALSLAAAHPDVAGTFAVQAAGVELSAAGKDIASGIGLAFAAGNGRAVALEYGRLMTRPSQGWLRGLLAPLMAKVNAAAEHEHSQQDGAVEGSALVRFDGHDVLPRITAPLLLAAGDEDVLFPAATIEETARLVPGSTLVWYRGKGHMRAVSDKRIARDVLDFVGASVTPV